MVSSTQWWTRRLTRLLLAGLLLTGAAATHAGLDVREGRLQLEDGVWVLDANLDINLTRELYSALTNGVALRMKHEIRIRSRRGWWRPDQDVAQLTINLDLTYHSLTRRYVLRHSNSGKRTSYGTLNEALGAITTLRNLPIIDNSLLEEEREYYGELRSQLAVDTLPLVLHPLDWFTSRWQISSEWATWPLET